MQQVPNTFGHSRKKPICMTSIHPRIKMTVGQNHLKGNLHKPFWMQALMVGMGWGEVARLKKSVIAGVLARFVKEAGRPIISWLRRKGVIQSILSFQPS
jgi:hypothetical protein